MNRRTILIAALAVLGAAAGPMRAQSTGQGQSTAPAQGPKQGQNPPQAPKLKMHEPSIADYLPILQASGYRAYSFDVSALRGMKAVPGIKEYVDGQEAGDLLSGLSFPLEFPLEERLTIGLHHAAGDSTVQCVIDADGSSFRSSERLRPIVWRGRTSYSYDARPFELVPPFEAGRFIPLVLYGSHWYDADFDVTRFCGEKFIRPDLSSDLLRECPHYYVFGITLKAE